MDSEEFRKIMLEISDKDYGMCPPPIDAQEGLNFLIKHFLGQDWYVTIPISQKQVNSEAIYQILEKYPKKKLLIERIRQVFLGTR